MSVNNINAKTFANVNSEAPNSIATVFSKYLSVGSSTADVFSKFEGADGEMGSPVCRKTDLQKTAGKTVHFTVKGSLSGFGKIGEQTLRGYEEKRRYGTHSVTVDIIRNGEAYTRKQIEFMAAAGSITASIGEDLADWWGRKKQTAALHRLRGRAMPAQNIMYPNAARTGINTMLSADIFSTSLIARAQSYAQQIGAKPLKMGKSRAGAPIPKFMFFGPEQIINPIMTESAYVAALNNAQVRGYGNNEQWDGGIADWQGQTVFHWATVDPDSDGPLGSMFDPRAKLGTAIAAGTTAINITGGGTVSPSASAVYFEFFPGYAWAHYEEEVIAADTNDYYLVVYNHVDSAAGGDAGKFGFYRYTGSGNTGNVITMKNEAGVTATGAGGRLASTQSGVASGKIGDVVWDTNVHTVAHPVGAPIFLANKKGVAYGYIACMGQNAILRAYGGGAMGQFDQSVAGKLQRESEDYEMIKGVAIEGIFGTDVWRDTQGNPRNYLLLPCAYRPNGVSLPTVNS